VNGYWVNSKRVVKSYLATAYKESYCNLKNGTVYFEAPLCKPTFCLTKKRKTTSISKFINNERSLEKTMKTFSAKAGEFERKWYLIDAKGEALGRLASKSAIILRGKHKPIYTPHVDTGDFIVIINAKKIILTGKKLQQKVYYHHSGYPGGLKSIVAEKLQQKDPRELIRLAVKGMLPKNRLGRKMITKLKIYAGDEHPHQAQNPEILDI
jgi:large subunit ribosomal protein L13